MIKQPLSPGSGCLKSHFLKLSILVFSSCIFSKGSLCLAQKFNGRYTCRKVVQVKQNKSILYLPILQPGKTTTNALFREQFCSVFTSQCGPQCKKSKKLLFSFKSTKYMDQMGASRLFSSEHVGTKQLLSWLCVHHNQTKDSDSGQDLIICQPQSSECPTVTIKVTETYFLKENLEWVNF